MLAGSGITNTNSTTIHGDVGTYPTPSMTGFNDVTLVGVNHGANAVTQQAKLDLLNAYHSAAGRPFIATGFELGGLTLTPGVYNNPVGFQITGVLTLDGLGSSDSVWIFQSGSTLVTASNSTVSLINGADACNVFWQVGSSATLGTGTDFAGTIMAHTSITLNNGATVDGRVLALNGAVTMDGNRVLVSLCDTVIDDSIRAIVDLLDPNDLPEAFKPGFYGGVLNTAVELSHNQGQMLFQQLSSRRLGRRRVPPAEHGRPLIDSGKRVVEHGYARSDGKNVLERGYARSDGKGALELAQPEPTAREDDPDDWNAWVLGSGLFSSGGPGLVPGEDFESGTFTVGADRAVTEHLALGLFASYQEGRGDYDDGGRLDLESVRVGAYAALDFDGFYTSGAAGVGTTDYDMKRPIQWMTLDRTASGDTDGSEYFAMLGTGYDFHAGNFTFGPSVSAQYTHLSIDGFTERGADSLDLRLSDFDGESLRTYLGGRIAYTHRVNPDFTLIPELRAFWQHEHLDQSAGIHAEFDGGLGPGFNYFTEGPEDDSVYAGAGVSMLIGDSLTLSTFYHANFGRNGSAQHQVSGGASWSF